MRGGGGAVELSGQWVELNDLSRSLTSLEQDSTIIPVVIQMTAPILDFTARPADHPPRWL